MSLAESLDAERAVLAVGFASRPRVKAAYAASVVKRTAYRPVFDRLFDLWWPAAVGERAEDIAAGEETEGPAASDPEALDAVREALRAALRAELVSGDLDAIDRLAGHAVGLLGHDTAAAGGRQSWFSYRVMRAVNPTTLVADAIAGILAERVRDRPSAAAGPLAERLARHEVTDRVQRFSDAVEAEVRRRSAEQRGPEAVGRSVVTPLVDQVEFLRASRDQIAELRREVAPVARRLATRLTARHHHGRSGRLDVRRTVRASMSSGGVPLDVVLRPRRAHKPELVVLCDVSGSVAAFAHFTVLLAFALREQFTRVRVFAFVDSLDEVTRLFDLGTDPVEALERMSREADLVTGDGHSDYGRAFADFEAGWADAVSPSTSLLVLGDARANYRSPGLEPLRAMVRRARHAFWLNPEPVQYWGSGDSVAAAYAEILPMVECRTIAQLQDFVASLLPG